MKTVRVCFEVAGLAVDEHGNPAPAGMQVILGEVTDEKYASVDYFEALKGFDVNAFVRTTPALQAMKIRPENVTIISPEEYDRKYGEDKNHECD